MRPHRFREQIALQLVAAHFDQYVPLLSGFNSFGDNLEFQGMRHFDDRIGDELRVFTDAEIGDKGAVNLQFPSR